VKSSRKPEIVRQKKQEVIQPTIIRYGTFLVKALCGPVTLTFHLLTLNWSTSHT